MPWPDAALERPRWLPVRCPVCQHSRHDGHVCRTVTGKHWTEGPDGPLGPWVHTITECSCRGPVVKLEPDSRDGPNGEPF